MVLKLAKKKKNKKKKAFCDDFCEKSKFVEAIYLHLKIDVALFQIKNFVYYATGYCLEDISV